MAAEKQLLGIKGTSCVTQIWRVAGRALFYSDENYQTLSNDVGACDGGALGYARLANNTSPCTPVYCSCGVHS